MSKTLRVNGWDRWQSYRNDRGAPPWIKVHRNLLTNQEWASLTDKEKGQLVSIWILAADRSGEIPVEPALIMRMCMLDSKPNIQKYIDLGFILQPDANLTPKGRQDDPPEKSREEKSRREEIAVLVVKYLNDKSGKRFKDTETNHEPIIARLKEGYELEDFHKAIDNQVREWGDNLEMNKFLRPSTLFQKKKFDGYVNNSTTEANGGYDWSLPIGVKDADIS